MELRRGSPEEAGVSQSRVKHIANLAEKWVSEGKTTSVIVLTARRGVIFLHAAFGRMGSEPDSPPVSQDSIFGFASVSKSFTATAIMLLVEEGFVGHNRPVKEYIPEFNGDGKDKVLVSHLLTHTSGLCDSDVEAIEDVVGGKVDLSPLEPTEDPGEHEILYFIYRTPLWQPPNTVFNYSNLGYCLLGEIVRRVSGQSFDSFTRERIFIPLGMEDTYFSLPDRLRERVIHHPKLDELDWDPIKQPGPPCCAYGTAMDLARFGQTFLNGGCYGDVHLLSPTTVNAMTCNQIPEIQLGLFPDGAPARQFGFGFFLLNNGVQGLKVPQLASQKAYGFAGASGAFFWVDPVFELVGVFLFTLLDDDCPYDLFIDA